jgi:hypothetical protein
MRKSTKRLLGSLALTAGAVGALGAVLMKKSARPARRGKRSPADTWARPGMKVIFRAELMPGRDGSLRTFYVTKLLPSGRVLLDQVSGEHAENEFERAR